MAEPCSTDIVIIGGGVAGLWLLNRFRDAGYHAVLLESGEVGGGQTLMSQGIIHGGLKYALDGQLGQATKTIAAMPDRWRGLLAGKGEIDLSGTKVLSPQYYMWSGGGMRSRLKTFLGSKSLRGRVDVVEPENYPEGFRRCTVAGTLYQLPDFVLDTPSLLANLLAHHGDYVYRYDKSRLSFTLDAQGNVSGIEIQGESPVRITAKRVILCAGQGNTALINQAGLQTIKGQLRPLKMLSLSKPHLPSLYVHCIGADFSLTPRITLTTHQDEQGNSVFYLGGELAEAGVGKPDEDLIATASKELAGSVPWVDLEGAVWRCHEVNRAEASTASGHRPDEAFHAEENNVIVAWPTKLTLCPALGDSLLQHVQQSFQGEATSQHLPLPAASAGNQPWDQL